MSSPQPLKKLTVLRWVAGGVASVVAAIELYGDGFLILTPVFALVAFRIKLILEPRWDMDAELKQWLT